MQTRYRLILVFLLIVLGLCVLNIYLTISSQNSPRVREQVAEQVRQQLLAQPLPQPGQQGIQGIDGKDGRDGKDSISTSTIVEKQTSVKEVIAKPEKGEKGDPGVNGKDARQVILSTDPISGDIIWKYEGDTLWNLLIESCQFKGKCEDKQL